MVRRTVTDAQVTDVEKRRYPSKHYVYIITVTWSDSAVNVIYRRYSKFFDFQMKLFALFPEEAGAKNPAQRMIPFLPGKKLFGRSHTREVAVGRLKQLNSYCQQLVRLPPKLSDCDAVIQFFAPTDEDINPPKQEEHDDISHLQARDENKKKVTGDIEEISGPIQSEQYTVIADYKKQQKNEVDLHAGDIVEVYEKGENGWWFISLNDTQGWAPGTFLAQPGGQDDDESLATCDEKYITNNQYDATQEDEVSFQRGVVLNVIQKSLDGWWKVKYQEKIGWVPATYLQEYRGPDNLVAPTQAIQIIGNVMNISDLESRKARPLPITPAGVSGTSDDRQNLAREVGGTDVKPTPPRRTTVRKTVRRGALKSRKRPQSVYYTVADFAGGSTEDSIPFMKGQKVEVLQQTESGWWYVKIDNEEGWAPSTFIEGREPGHRDSNNSLASLGSLDDETGEKNRKFKPSIGSSNGAFTPISPRPLPSIPAEEEEGSGEMSALPAKRAERRPPPGVPRPSNSASSQGNQAPAAGGIAALRQQLEQKLTTREEAGPPPVPRKTNQGGIPPPVQRKTSQGVVQQKPPLPVKRTEQWKTVAGYDQENDSEISFKEGARVEVIEKDDSGWWLIGVGGKEGWAPSTFLEKC